MTALARFANERLARMCETQGASLDQAMEVLADVNCQFPRPDMTKSIDGVTHTDVSYARQLARRTNCPFLEQVVWDFLTD